MLSEKEYICKMLAERFTKYSDCKLAIYGLGNNTKLLLEDNKTYNIVALLDSIHEGENYWSLPVVDCKTAHEMGVKVIIILARAANVSIIFQRIKLDCIKYGIKVFDINGEDQIALAQKSKEEYKCPSIYKNITKEKIIKAVEEAEVISFDIFDTLLKREVLYPTDVFYLVEEEAKKQSIDLQGINFYKERIAAERELYPKCNPRLAEIYSNLVSKNILTEEIAQKLMRLELEEERKQLTAKNTMQKLYNYILKQKKPICITSDMYLSEDTLADILLQNGYKNWDNLLVSCEYNTSKSERLFEILKEKYPNKKILHIGDNSYADIEAVQRHGINTFYVPNALQMLRDSSFSHIMDYANKLSNRLVIGRLINHFFDSSFLFAETEGRIKLSSVKEMGAYLIEPILSLFVHWMIKKMEECKADLLILGARDGWIIKRMLDVYTQKHKLPFEYKYIYLSRAACTLAGVKTKEDVQYASQLAFSGKTEEMLKRRFLLNDGDLADRKEGESDEEYVSRHSDYILKQAEKYRKYFNEYLESEGIYKYENIAFMDFVSSGTCQLWMENILNYKLKGLYFIKIYDKYKEHLDIEYMQEYACVYENAEGFLIYNYFFMENIMSSLEPSVKYIGIDSKQRFENENRNENEIQELYDIHQGILGSVSSKCIDYTLADNILGLVQNKYSKHIMRYFQEHTLMDEFCNRIFDLRIK